MLLSKLTASTIHHSEQEAAEKWLRSQADLIHELYDKRLEKDPLRYQNGEVLDSRAGEKTGKKDLMLSECFFNG